MLKLSLDKNEIQAAVRTQLAIKFPALVTEDTNLAVKVVVTKGEVSGVEVAIGATGEDLSGFAAPKAPTKRGPRKAKAVEAAAE